MKNNSLAISIGRFQPYTLFYKKLHKKIIEECSFLIIYVIRPNIKNPKYNPFSTREVSKMIRNSFTKEELNFIKINFIHSENEINLNTDKKNLFYYYYKNEYFEINNKSFKTVVVEEESDFKNEKDILDFVYSKKIDYTNFVEKSNFKYLRRLVVPF